MKGTILTRADLDMGRCENPDCTHEDHDQILFLHGLCHPGAGHRASYDKQTGVLTLACRECSEPVAHIMVARGEVN
jgi:hypothetical protein